MAVTATEATSRSSGAPRPLDVALWLAGQGIHVHPLLPGRKIPPRGCDRCWRGPREQPNPAYVDHSPHDCPCLRAGRYCHGVLAATTARNVIEHWWAEMPKAGVGVATGKSGLLILDVDRHGGERPASKDILPGLAVPADVDLATIWDGEDVLGLLCEIRAVTPPTIDNRTMTIRTPSGGLQVWFRVSSGTDWTPSAGKLGWQLDIRAGHSYGIAPGTTTAAGSYVAQGDCRTVAPLPQWLEADLIRTGHRREQRAQRPHTDWKPPQLAGGRGYVAAALQAELEKVAGAPNGQRSHLLNEAAYSLGQLVGSGLLEQEAVHTALTEAAAAAGVNPGERKAQDTIRRGIEAGMRRPRQIGARA